jgi:hypothetical protein
MPDSIARGEQAELMIPVPPMKRTRMDGVLPIRPISGHGHLRSDAETFCMRINSLGTSQARCSPHLLLASKGGRSGPRLHSPIPRDGSLRL